MIKIAILGATSQIATDLIRGWIQNNVTYELDLFARDIEKLNYSFLNCNGNCRIRIMHLESFGENNTKYDAIINFVGVGNPALAAEMGASILDITHYYDELVLNYLNNVPECRYLFISSGAAYGCTFELPVSRASSASININNLSNQEFYSVAKLYSEVRHRARPELIIFDIRVFNIFSRTQDLNARFFVTDIVRSIRDNAVLQVSDDEMVRDFLHPSDFQNLIDVLLIAEPENTAVDCYSAAPISKKILLENMTARFGLMWESKASANIVNATGNKSNYYSENKRAKDFGFEPIYTSIEGLCIEVEAILNKS